jgi:hypothetical protein
MRLFEIKKKFQPVFDPIEDARAQLEHYKEIGMKENPNGTLQLFIPRKVNRYTTRKERYDYILKDRAKYAFDDEGNLIPHYEKWINSANESFIKEGAPIIGGGSPILPGQDKPIGALLWTSTAKKMPNGTWSSDWNMYARNAGMDQEKVGYLYKVKPNTVVYELNTNRDAEIIYEIFNTLGRPNTAYTDPKEWEKMRSSGYQSEIDLIKKDFPWPELQKHFDCVHHFHYRGLSFNGEKEFTYSYDCESTVWFKPDQLELLGQVPVFQDYLDEED